MDQKLKEAVKLVVKNFIPEHVSGSLYEHMSDAIKGKNVKWHIDSVLSQFTVYGPVEISLYQFIRKNRDEFLSPEERIMNTSFGAVRVFWKAGGYSDATIYQTTDGERMLCCANWISGPVLLKEQVMSIKSVEPLTYSGPVV